MLVKARNLIEALIDRLATRWINFRIKQFEKLLSPKGVEQLRHSQADHLRQRAEVRKSREKR